MLDATEGWLVRLAEKLVMSETLLAFVNEDSGLCGWPLNERLDPYLSKQGADLRLGV